MSDEAREAVERAKAECAKWEDFSHENVKLSVRDLRALVEAAERTQQAEEAVQHLSAGKPLGEIAGKHTILNQGREINRLRQRVAEVEELVQLNERVAAKSIADLAEIRRERDALLAERERVPKVNSVLLDCGLHFERLQIQRIDVAPGGLTITVWPNAAMNAARAQAGAGEEGGE